MTKGALKIADTICGCSLLIVLLAHSGQVARAQREQVDAALSFESPRGMRAQSNQPPPVIRAWVSPDGQASVTVIIAPLPEGETAQAIREFADWPGAGQSFAEGFGSASSEVLSKAYRAKCSYLATPVRRDVNNWAFEVRLDFTCATVPQPTPIRTSVIRVLTTTGQLVVRIDAQASAYALAGDATEQIWSTLQVTSDHRIVTPIFRFKDYKGINSAFVVGRVIGSLVAATAFGALLTAIFIMLRLRPMPALIAAQIIVIAFGMWGAEENGVWDVDWIFPIPTAVVAILLLRGWARSRWNKRQARQIASDASAG